MPPDSGLRSVVPVMDEARGGLASRPIVKASELSARFFHIRIVTLTIECRALPSLQAVAKLFAEPRVADAPVSRDDRAHRLALVRRVLDAIALAAAYFGRIRDGDPV